MNVPILRKTVRFPNFATTTVSVRTVLPFHKRRVHFSATRRRRQCRLNLIVRAEHRPIVNFLHAAFDSCFVNRCIDQIQFWTITSPFGSPSPAGAPWRSFFTERFQNRLDIRSPFVTRYQTWWLEIQTLGRFLHQQFRVLFRSLAVDNF